MTFGVMHDHTVWREGGRDGGREGGREREGGRGRWVDLCFLMTPGFSKDIRCLV